MFGYCDESLIASLLLFHQHPPGHKSIFNPIVTLSPLVEYECKSANVGVTPRVTFFEAVTKLFLNLKGYGLVLDQGFTPSLVLN